MSSSVSGSIRQTAIILRHPQLWVSFSLPISRENGFPVPSSLSDADLFVSLFLSFSFSLCRHNSVPATCVLSISFLSLSLSLFLLLSLSLFLRSRFVVLPPSITPARPHPIAIAIAIAIASSLCRNRKPPAFLSVFLPCIYDLCTPHPRTRLSHLSFLHFQFHMYPYPFWPSHISPRIALSATRRLTFPCVRTPPIMATTTTYLPAYHHGRLGQF